MKFCNNNKGIISLALVFTLGFFSLSLAVGSSVGSLIELKKNRESVSGDQSFYTAEAAVREGIHQYIADSTYSGEILPSINDISTTSVTVAPSILGWQYKEVSGIAEDANTRKVGNIILLFPGGAAFDYAIYSEDDLTIQGGAGNIIIGDIFSNQEISCGGNPDIQGDAYSGGNNNSCSGNADSVNLDVKIIPPPDIDITFYQNEAIINGTDFYAAADGETYLNNQTHNLPPEIVYIEDTSTETNIQNAILTGSLAVKGDLQISGGTLITGANDDAAIIVEGNLRITGNTTVNGLIYVTGTTNFSGGNNTINGSIVSIGGTETSIIGSVTINYQGLAGPPGGIDDSGPPEVISWQEE